MRQARHEALTGEECLNAFGRKTSRRETMEKTNQVKMNISGTLE
jgi:hypothetical protein